MKIKTEKIKEIIGPSGKVIKGICENTNSKIDIDDSGVLKVASPNDESLDKALKMINDIIVEPEMGVIYNGKVVKTVDFGAFVNFLGNRDGLVHISELQDQRTEKTTDVCKEGDEVKEKLLVLMIGARLNFLLKELIKKLVKTWIIKFLEKKMTSYIKKSEWVKTEILDKVGWVELCHENPLNPLSAGFVEAIYESCKNFDEDPNVKCIVLIGSKKAFAAGADLKEMLTFIFRKNI